MADESTLEQRVEMAPDVLVQRLPDDELVLLDLTTEKYFGLDATGTAMWDELTETRHVGHAYDRLRDRFDVAPEVLRHDLDTFVRRLAERGLLQLGGDPS
jgi:hypothetical protein